jgi:hypothetical protein
MKRRYPSAAIVILLAAYALLTPTLFRLSYIPFDSDSATHALDGLQIAADIYHLNGQAFLKHFYFAKAYPPLLPTYLAPSFLLLEPTYWSARYPILLLTMVFLALTYRVGKSFTQQPRAGLTAIFLAATSPYIWIHSSLVMEELLAMIAALLVTLVYVRAERRQLKPFWIGVCLAFTLLSKLSIGIPMVGAVMLTIWGGPESFRAKVRLMWKAFAPLVIIGVLWWGHPAKIRGFINYAQAAPPAYESMGWQQISHYWKALLTTYTLSPPLGLMALLSLPVAAFHWKESHWRLPLAAALMTWLVLLLRRQLNLRFFISAASMAFLLVGNWLARWAGQFRGRDNPNAPSPRLGDELTGPASSEPPPGTVAGSGRLLKNLAFPTKLLNALLAVALLVSVLPYLGARMIAFPFLMEVAYEADPQINDLYAWVANRTTYDHPIFLVNGWDQISTFALDFYMGATHWPHWESTQAINVFLEDPQKNPEATSWLQELLKSTSRGYIVHLGNTPVPNAGAWWAYEAVFSSCWDKTWQAARTFEIHLWDGRLQDDIPARPFHYARAENRQAARRDYRYLLPVEVKVAPCQAPGE